jgi:filamentous hemagglutinin family protein
MNHIYRSIWSEALTTWIAVSENTKGKCKCSSTQTKLLAAGLLFCTSTSWALPTGQQVVAGQVDINTPQTGQMQINQTSLQAIVNWQGFSINSNESVNIQQPNINAILLNRVVGADASVIQGRLNANGQVYLINPNGVLFGKTAQVDVGGLVATTHNLSDSDFLSGKYHFIQDTIDGIVSNQGYIKVPEGGMVVLMGTQVSNEGTIETPRGTTILAAGKTVDLDFKGDGLVEVKVPEAALNAQVIHKGAIHADGGRVVLTAKAAGQLVDTVLNSEGLIQAQSLVTRNGEIILDGGDNGILNVSGTLDASAPTQGDGGLIKTSASKVKIEDSAKITTKSARGKTGTWLINSNDYSIAKAGGDMTGLGLSTRLTDTNISIVSTAGGTSANGDLNVNDEVTWSANKLTLNAQRNININANLNGSGPAQLALEYGQNAIESGNTSNYFIKYTNDFLSTPIAINLPEGANFSTKLGSDGVAKNYTVITRLGLAGSTTGKDLQGINGNLGQNYALGKDIFALATNNWNSGEGFLPIGNEATPFTGHFTGLGHAIAFLTIKRPTTDNVGLFGYTGAGSSITDVGLIGGSVTGQNHVGGLAGYFSGWNNIMQNVYTSTNVSGVNTVGGLVGYNGYSDILTGNIRNAYARGNISGTGSIGGLVGYNNGIIDTVYAAGNVTGSGYQVGGLVGRNDSGSLNNAYATGNVIGFSEVGGLVGVNYKTITNAYATGNVTGDGSGDVGGLVGHNSGSISNTYATGNVTSGYRVGGLVGLNDTLTGIINNSYATGHLSGSTYKIGGLVGLNYGSINNSYATSNIDGVGATYVGGLVGYNGGSINNSFWDMQTTQQAIGVGNETVSTGVTGKTSTEMKQLATFSNAGWDIDNQGGTGTTWRIYEGQSTPLLRQGLTALTIKANNINKTYDGKIVDALSGAEYSLIDAITSGRLLNLTNPYNNAINVGTYTPTGLFSNQQGFDITIIGSLTITPAALSVTAADIIKTYDGTTLAHGTAIAADGSSLFGSDFLTGGQFTFADKNAGNDKTVSLDNVIVNDGNNGKNYLVNYVPNTHSVINKANLTLTSQDITKTYDGTTQASGSAIIADGRLFGTDKIKGGNFAFTDKNAGTDKTVQVDSVTLDDGNSGKNYLVNYVPNTRSIIHKAALTITPNTISKTYGQNIIFDGKEFSASGLQNREMIDKVTLNSAGATATAHVIESPYEITADNATGENFDDRNYSITYHQGKLLVNPADLNISLADASKTYGQTISLNAKISNNGLQNGETIGAIDVFSAGADAKAHVMNSPYNIKASNARGGTFRPSDYHITYIDGKLTVEKADLEITANNISKSYGQTIQLDGKTGFIARNLKNGEKIGAIDLASAGTSATAQVTDNPYDITASNARGENFLPSDYKITYVNGKLTINPVALTITAKDVDKAYDGIAFSGGNGVSYSGFVNNESSSVLHGTLQYSGDSQGAINSGDYAIIPSGLSARNYKLSYLSGKLSIDKQPSTPVKSNLIPDEDDGRQDNISGLITKITDDHPKIGLPNDDHSPENAHFAEHEVERPDSSIHDITEEFIDNLKEHPLDKPPVTPPLNKPSATVATPFNFNLHPEESKLIVPTLSIKNSAGRVKDLQLSDNKKFLSLLLEDGSVRVWDFERGLQRRIKTLEKNPHALTEIGGADDKGELLSIASKAGIGAYDVISSSSEGTIKTSDINHFVTSNDAHLLLMNAGTDDLSSWNSTQNKKLWQIDYPRGAVNSLAMTDDKHYAAVLSNQAGSYLLPANLQLKSLTDAVSLIDMTTGKVLKGLPNLGDHVVYMQFKDNNTLQLGLANGDMLDWTITENSPKKVAALGEAITAVDPLNHKYAYLLKNGTVRVVDAQGNVQLSIQNEENPYQYALLLEEGEKLLTVMASGDLALWDVASGKKMLRLFSTLQGWTVMDAFGRFDGSEESFENFTWLANEENIPLDSFSENYYEPGLLANVLQNQDYLNSNPDMLKEGINLPPKVVLQLADQQTEGENVKLQLDLYDRGGGIDKITLYHNGRMLSNSNDLISQQTPQDNSGHRVLTFNIAPSAGKNSFKVIASNKMGIENSSGELNFDGKSKAYASSVKVLTVGIDRYSDAKLNLDYSVADANSIGQAIKNSSKMTASKSLLNENATKPKILAELKELSQGTQQDVLVIYFAGHGLAVGKEWYFLPYETKIEPTVEKMAATGISATELSDIFRNSKIQHILLMVDSCYSGAGMDAFSKLENGQRYFTRQLSRSLGITVLTATTKNQQAAELKSLGHGLFTYLMAQELENKSALEPVTAHSMAESIVKNLPIFSKKTIGSTQEPVAYTHGNDFVLTDIVNSAAKNPAENPGVPGRLPKK